jgi:hypothetical protein
MKKCYSALVQLSEPANLTPTSIVKMCRGYHPQCHDGETDDSADRASTRPIASASAPG